MGCTRGVPAARFVVDALPTDRHVVALDWRGFGLSDASGADSYWIPDYVGDLDAALVSSIDLPQV